MRLRLSGNSRINPIGGGEMNDINDLFGYRISNENGPARIHHRRNHFSVRCLDLDNNPNLLEQETETLMHDDGPVTVTRSEVLMGACGHLIGTTDNLAIGICAICGELLCSRPECISLRCEKCNHLICKLCSSEVEPGMILCTICRRSYRLKKIFKSGLSGIHKALSKEF